MLEHENSFCHQKIIQLIFIYESKKIYESIYIYIYIYIYIRMFSSKDRQEIFFNVYQYVKE